MILLFIDICYILLLIIYFSTVTVGSVTMHIIISRCNIRFRNKSYNYVLIILKICIMLIISLCTFAIKVFIAGNQLTDSDAKLLANALKNNMSLQHLDLSYNKFGELGAIYLANGLVRVW